MVFAYAQADSSREEPYEEEKYVLFGVAYSKIKYIGLLIFLSIVTLGTIFAIARSATMYFTLPKPKKTNVTKTTAPINKVSNESLGSTFMKAMFGKKRRRRRRR